MMCKKVWRLAVPGILAAGIGQINLLVGTSIATGQAGAAAWLYYADRLYQLPMGVIGVALSVALLPELARRLAKGETARAHGTQDMAVLAASRPDFAGGGRLGGFGSADCQPFV